MATGTPEIYQIQDQSIFVVFEFFFFFLVFQMVLMFYSIKKKFLKVLKKKERVIKHVI